MAPRSNSRSQGSRGKFASEYPLCPVPIAIQQGSNVSGALKLRLVHAPPPTAACCGVSLPRVPGALALNGLGGSGDFVVNLTADTSKIVAGMDTYGVFASGTFSSGGSSVAFTEPGP